MAPLPAPLDRGAHEWLGNFWRLTVRYDRLAEDYGGFFHLICALITLRKVLKGLLRARSKMTGKALGLAANRGDCWHRMPGKASKWIPDDLWERVQPLLPKPRRRRNRYPGRKPIEERKVLTGMTFGLWTGIPWREMPTELGCGSGMTCLVGSSSGTEKGWFRNSTQCS